MYRDLINLVCNAVILCQLFKIKIIFGNEVQLTEVTQQLANDGSQVAT